MVEINEPVPPERSLTKFTKPNPYLPLTSVAFPAVYLVPKSLSVSYGISFTYNNIDSPYTALARKRLLYV